MYEITVKKSFSAAHRLIGHGGLCENLHGHNWVAQVSFTAEKLDKQGMVIDFARVSEELGKITGMLDHKLINEVPPFDSVNPTAEKIAEWIFKELAKSLNASPSRVTISETDTASATYYEQEE